MGDHEWIPGRHRPSIQVDRDSTRAAGDELVEHHAKVELDTIDEIHEVLLPVAGCHDAIENLPQHDGSSGLLPEWIEEHFGTWRDALEEDPAMVIC